MSSESFAMTLVSMKDELPRRLKFITVAIAAWGGIAALFSLVAEEACSARWRAVTHIVANA